MAYQIQIRRDTADNWAAANPILAQGEMGYEIDTNKAKFGNGATPYNDRPYFGGTAGGGDFPITGADAIAVLTLAQYNELDPPDPATLYFITAE